LIEPLAKLRETADVTLQLESSCMDNRTIGQFYRVFAPHQVFAFKEVCMCPTRRSCNITVTLFLPPVLSSFLHHCHDGVAQRLSAVPVSASPVLTAGLLDAWNVAPVVTSALRIRRSNPVFHAITRCQDYRTNCNERGVARDPQLKRDRQCYGRNRTALTNLPCSRALHSLRSWGPQKNPTAVDRVKISVLRKIAKR